MPARLDLQALAGGKRSCCERALGAFSFGGNVTGYGKHQDRDVRREPEALLTLLCNRR